MNLKDEILNAVDKGVAKAMFDSKYLLMYIGRIIAVKSNNTYTIIYDKEARDFILNNTLGMSVGDTVHIITKNNPSTKKDVFILEDVINTFIASGITIATAWSDITGKPNTFTPSEHTHNEYITDEELSEKGYLTSYTETDPTVPSWAKQSTKPTYTASEVGADSSGSADNALAIAKSYTDTKISNLIDNAPESMDTLKEVSDVLSQNQTVVDALNSSIGNKVDKITGKGLSTNDFTNGLKANYDAAYTHSQSAHAPSNAEKNTIIGIQKNGTDIVPNSTTRKVNVTVPTKTSELTNDLGFKTTDTNTWRGIQDNLTSDSSVDSLSAKQGKALKTFVDGKAPLVHEHNYAGSSSSGGAANSATKLTTARKINGVSFDGTSNIIADACPTIIGTHTSTTATWTGNAPTIDALYDGLSIRYWLPYNSNGSVTLNLTLADGTTTGAIPCFYGASTRLNHYGYGRMVSLTYRVNPTYNGTTGTTGWYCEGDYYSDANLYLKDYDYIKAVTAITAGRLIGGTNNGYKNIASGVVFDISYPLLLAGSAISASSVGTNNYYSYYSCSLATTYSFTATLHSSLFLKGTLSGNLFTVNSNVLTCTIPTSDDGFVYMYVGKIGGTNNTTAYYSFAPVHPIFTYKNGKFQELSGLSTYSDSAAKATNDESGNNIKSSYAASLEQEGTTVQLKSKSGEVLSSITMSSGMVGIPTFIGDTLPTSPVLNSHFIYITDTIERS